ncbi:PTPA-CTERM sorting domain-containing protein [Nodosilinea sp. LEGE 07088]|nr:PTPA-CTERM sorting domain-containing protein [Nodosilinea sp. LEGE 07088]
MATLNFNGPISEVTLSNFGVRYQSITGTSLGTSGTGKGTPIPTPALLPGLVGLGVAALRKRRNADEEVA